MSIKLVVRVPFYSDIFQSIFLLVQMELIFTSHYVWSCMAKRLQKYKKQPIYYLFHLWHCSACKYLTLIQRHAQNCISLVSCWNHNSVKANRIVVYENNKPKGKFDKDYCSALARRFCSKQANKSPDRWSPLVKTQKRLGRRAFP